MPYMNMYTEVMLHEHVHRGYASGNKKWIYLKSCLRFTPFPLSAEMSICECLVL